MHGVLFDVFSGLCTAQAACIYEFCVVFSWFLFMVGLGGCTGLVWVEMSGFVGGCGDSGRDEKVGLARTSARQVPIMHRSDRHLIIFLHISLILRSSNRFTKARWIDY